MNTETAPVTVPKADAAETEWNTKAEFDRAADPVIRTDVGSDIKSDIGSEKNGSEPGEIASEPQGRIDTVRKVLAGIGCVLMLLSILFPFLRMTEPNGAVADMTRRETFTIGMPGWDAGPYIIWVLILLSCALIFGFQYKNLRKKSRHGCRLVLLVILFDALTIAGFIAQYGPDDITFFPLAGFWLLVAGCLLAWIASFLHKRKKKPKKNGKGKSQRKMYREMKKQQKLEREERMRKTAGAGKDGLK